MHAWKRDALLRHEDYLRISLKPNTILTRLVECGFMTEAERKSVEAKEGQDEQVGRMIEILRLKGNEEFGAFLKILEETGNASVASRLGKSAQQYKLEHGKMSCFHCLFAILSIISYHTHSLLSSSYTLFLIICMCFSSLRLTRADSYR